MNTKTKKSKKVIAWHFVGDTLRDGRPVPADGVWLEHEGEIEMCERGLHASINVWDALQYAPGGVLCKVECGGKIIKGDDKLVCTRRKIIKRKDVTDLMRLFARKQALSVIHLWDAPAIVREYLETGDESKRAAARAAAWDADWDAARTAAWDAAWAAAWDAAWAAARAAAWAAARAAAWDAAWDAAKDAFTDMVNEAFSE